MCNLLTFLHKTVIIQVLVSFSSKLGVSKVSGNLDNPGNQGEAASLVHLFIPGVSGLSPSFGQTLQISEKGSLKTCNVADY